MTARGKYVRGVVWVVQRYGKADSTTYRAELWRDPYDGRCIAATSAKATRRQAMADGKLAFGPGRYLRSA